jgi:malate synthase
MNMPIAAVNRLEIEKQSFMPELVTTFSETRQPINSDLINNCLEPSEILDKHFALQNGSHKDVKQYIVYFCHIMAFFADGSHCGLTQPKQFVAFLGCKETPESIVLKENNVHIELVLNTHTNRGKSAIHIEFPEQMTFTSKTGDDYFVK